MKESSVSDAITAKCPFCERLFLMSRPLFVTERERTACPACRDEAKRNMQEMREDIAGRRSE